jgi:serine/threonine protein kinase
VTHRDLKPANVLLGADGALISDFGIAQAFDSTRVTATGTVVGTAAYMAPEQVLGDPVGPPADIYALGLVMLECLTGVREYGGTMVECDVGRLHRPPRIPAGLPSRLEDLLRQTTARHPADRPTAAAVADALRAGERTLVFAPVSPSLGSRAPRRRQSLLLAGIPVIAALIAGAAVMVRPANDVSPSQPIPSAPAGPAPVPAGPLTPPNMAADSLTVSSSPAAPAAETTAPPAPPPVIGKANKGKKNGHGGNNQHSDD